MSDNPTPQRPNYRAGKAQVGVYLRQEAVFTFQELLIKLSRERGRRVTAQEAVGEALKEFAQKHNVQLNLG